MGKGPRRSKKSKREMKDEKTKEKRKKGPRREKTPEKRQKEEPKRENRKNQHPLEKERLHSARHYE